jgi:hypothetical protein
MESLRDQLAGIKRLLDLSLISFSLFLFFYFFSIPIYSLSTPISYIFPISSYLSTPISYLFPISSYLSTPISYLFPIYSLNTSTQLIRKCPIGPQRRFEKAAKR